MAAITSVAQTHHRSGIIHSHKLLFVFLGAFLFGCLAQIGFSCYVMSRQLQAAANPFDPSIIHHLNKKLVLAGLVAGVLGMVITLWALTLLRCGKPLAKIVIPFLWLIAAGVLVAGYWFLARTEGQYLFHSRYFKLYLLGGVPLALAMLLGIVGIFRLIKSSKQP